MVDERIDVLRAVDVLRRRQAEVANLQLAYESADRSRFGRLRTLWSAAKAAIRGRDVRDMPRSAADSAIAQHGSPHTPAWPEEVAAASRHQIADLQQQLLARSRELEGARKSAALVTAELDAVRAEAARLKSGLLRTAQVIELERRSAREARNVSAALLERPAAPASNRPGSSEHEAKRAQLIDILKRGAALLDVAQPDVSVIIPTYNQVGMTLDCLMSIAQALRDGPTMQIIVVDDASPKEPVCGTLAGLPFVTLLRNGNNLGFLRSCNSAARIATGRYIHFLNNDTLVRPGWLKELVTCADGDERIGAVGSKLLFADGSLQEAGGIIWRDASGWNYGRGDDPEDAKYNFLRDVDYCSGASLLVRIDVFRDLGGFNDLYAPAYFEDSDLCFAIRARGMRVVYQPKSVVVHLEGASSGTSLDAGVKRHQVSNKPKFVSRWSDALEAHYEPDSVTGIRAARRLQAPRTLVMIDNYVPEYDKDSGSNKLFNFIKLFMELGYNVIYVPDNYIRSEPYTSVLQDLGVEVLYRSVRQTSLESALRERLALADVVWMGRPDLGDKYVPIVREFPALPILYDTHDLHYVRVRRELELKGITDPARWEEWEGIRALELRVVESVDVAMTVTAVEQAVLEKAGMNNVLVVPNVHDSFVRTKTYDETDGLLFIGGYVHSPNVDAVVWLCEEIMPLVWRSHPNMRVTLVGSNPPVAVHQLAADRVVVAGYVHDVEPYFQAARVFVAPLRYGAGLKGKIGHAFAYGLPTVTTPIGAEGFDLENGSDALIAEDSAGFAEQIIRAYDEPELWQTLSAGGSRVIRRFSPEVSRERLATAVEMGFRRRAEALRSPAPAAPI